MRRFIYSKENILKGALIYSVFDGIAAIILNEYSITRFIGMMLMGGTFYAFEIPNYFSWIEKKTAETPVNKKSFIKTLYALAYFNPVWIARHLIIIELLTHKTVSPEVLNIAYKSFLFNIPISFLGNYIIQNLIYLPYRFVASAIFSGLMAVYYAFSTVIFS